MESLQQQANIESFSYGWLSSRTSSKNSFVVDHSDLLSFHDEFDFALPSTAASSSPLINADKIFSNGVILPFYQSENSDAVLRRALSFDSCSESFHRRGDDRVEPSRFSCDAAASTSQDFRHPDAGVRSLMRKCGSTRQRLHGLKSCAKKYLCFFGQLREKVKRMRLAVSRKAAKTSPVTGAEWGCGNVAASNGEERIERSISDAVLYCKRSFVCPAENAQMIASV